MPHWLSYMTRNDGSRLAYLWRAWLAVMLGTALIAVLAVLVFPVAETAQEAPPPPFPGVVLLSPAVPSLALWGVLEVLRRALPTYWHAAGGAALVFAGVFKLASGVQGGLIFAWPYFLSALTFLAWHLRSDLEGVTMTFALQVAANAALNLRVFQARA